MPSTLLSYLFDSQPHRLSGELQRWLEASPRFALFAETYRDKIRKKIRLTLHDPQSTLDLRAELEVAYRLLADRRLVLAYEPYASQPGRGPDYAVTYRTNLVFNLEVARLRPDSAPDVGADGIRPPGEHSISPRQEHLLRLLLDKLGQMQPNLPNLLVVHVPADLSVDLTALLHTLKLMADRKDPAFYAAARYASPAAFYRYFTRLSVVLLWPSPAQLWVNKQSRSPLPDEVLRRVGELLSD